MPEHVTPHGPDDAPIRGRSAHDTIRPGGDWDGPTYYGRSQLKPAPFENFVVGGYIFLAGLSGAAALVSALADTMRGRREQALVRRGRYLSLLAPTLGAALLIYDLRTPKRFYNMLRIFKRTSPMSIGTWILMSFSACAGLAATAQAALDWLPGWRWLRGAARAGHLPAAAAGAGLATYTASLLSATSTPFWAAAPRALAARFGASSFASGAAALSLGEDSPRSRRRLDALALAALAAELAAINAAEGEYQRKGVGATLDTGWGKVDRYGATHLGVLLPLGLYAASLAVGVGRRGSTAVQLSAAASLAALAGSLVMRIAVMSAGDESARRPEISFPFAQPRNLPER